MQITITSILEGYIPHNSRLSKMCPTANFMSKMQASTVIRRRIEELHIIELIRVKYLCVMLLVVLMFLCHFHLQDNIKQSTLDFWKFCHLEFVSNFKHSKVKIYGKVLVLTAVQINREFYITSCRLVHNNRRFGGACSLFTRVY
jgi:hypothetical protein